MKIISNLSLLVVFFFNKIKSFYFEKSNVNYHCVYVSPSKIHDIFQLFTDVCLMCTYFKGVIIITCLKLVRDDRIVFVVTVCEERVNLLIDTIRITESILYRSL